MNNRQSVVNTIYNPEFVNLQPSDISPLMSKCEIKVLYVGQNRNKSYISKEVATKMAKSLRGNPIIGHYIKEKQDFGDHGNQVTINGNGVKFEKLTKPYGYIAPNAKVWFQFFEDTDEFGNITMREYLMAEGYLWTGQFKECKRVLENSNPQSMELDEETLNGYWSKDNNEGIEFFIINDAIFSALCILGDDVEPCFEGARVSTPTIGSNFSLEEDTVKELIEMMKELHYALNINKGGESMIKGITSEDKVKIQFDGEDGGEASNSASDVAPEAGSDTNENTDTDPAEENASGQETPSDAPSGEDTGSSEGEVDPAEEGVILNDTDREIIASVGEDYIPVDSTETITEAVIKDGATNVPTQILQNACSKDDEKKKEKNLSDKDKEDKTDSDNSEDNTEDKNSEKSSDSNEDEENKKKKKDFALYEEKISQLEKELIELRQFKANIENEQKDELIASFYMLSDEDKKEVVANKANYSLREIKAELSMICVDKKINFSENADSEPTTYNLNSINNVSSSNLPAWLERVKEIHDSKK